MVRSTARCIVFWLKGHAAISLHSMHTHTLANPAFTLDIL